MTTDIFVARGHTAHGVLMDSVPMPWNPHPREYTLDQWAQGIRTSPNFKASKSVSGEACYLATPRASLGGKSMAQLIVPKLGLNSNRFFMSPDGKYTPEHGLSKEAGTGGVWRAYNNMGTEIGTPSANQNSLIQSLPDAFHR